jgi:uncharacterized protein YecT (DUF1311 family)
MLTALFLFLQALLPYVANPRQEPASPQQVQPVQRKPCFDAKTQLASNECFAQLYQETDAQLNVAYNRVVAFMKRNLATAQEQNSATQITYNETAMTKLLAAQRAWLAYRDANCNSVKFQYEGGSIQPTIWSQCMAETTQQRITILTTAYDLAN